MKLDNSVLEDVRVAVGLSRESPDFDTDLLMHINAAIGKLRQNDVIVPIMISDDSTTWGDLQDPTKTDANEYFQMVPLFITLSTKIIFDPPPPSTVEQYVSSIDQILWRLKIAYEDLNTDETTLYL